MAIPGAGGAGRAVAFTPVAGSEGFVTLAGVNRNVTAWTPTIAANVIDVTNFNSPTDANGLIHEEFIFGTIKATFTITGPLDAGAFAYNIMPGSTGTGFLGYRGGLGFSISFGVVSTGGGTKADTTGRGEYNITIQANGLITYTGHS